MTGFDNPAHFSHVPDQILVDNFGGADSRPVGQMDRCLSGQMTVDKFGKKGNDRRNGLRKNNKYGAQGGIGQVAVGFVECGWPDPVAGAPDIPSREIGDKWFDRGNGFWYLICPQLLVNFEDSFVEAGEDPKVELGRDLLHLNLWLPVIKGGIVNEEFIRVPECHQSCFQLFLPVGLGDDDILTENDRTAHEVKTERVGTIFDDIILGVGVVAVIFAHLPTVVAHDDSLDDDVFEAMGLKEGVTNDVHDVKPGPELAGVLGDKVGRKVGEELFFVFKGIMAFGIGHTGRLDPAIEDFGDTTSHAITFGTGDSDVIDVGAVKIGNFFTRPVFQILDGTGNKDLATGTFPDGDRGAPVAGPANAPIGSGVDPQLKAAVFEVTGNPIDVLDICLPQLLDGRNVEIPGFLDFVDQGRLTTMAVRIAMDDRFQFED